MQATEHLQDTSNGSRKKQKHPIIDRFCFHDIHSASFAHLLAAQFKNKGCIPKANFVKICYSVFR